MHFQRASDWPSPGHMLVPASGVGRQQICPTLASAAEARPMQWCHCPVTVATICPPHSLMMVWREWGEKRHERQLTQSPEHKEGLLMTAMIYYNICYYLSNHCMGDLDLANWIMLPGSLTPRGVRQVLYQSSRGGHCGMEFLHSEWGIINNV